MVLLCEFKKSISIIKRYDFVKYDGLWFWVCLVRDYYKAVDEEYVLLYKLVYLLGLPLLIGFSFVYVAPVVGVHPLFLWFGLCNAYYKYYYDNPFDGGGNEEDLLGSIKRDLSVNMIENWVVRVWFMLFACIMVVILWVFSMFIPELKLVYCYLGGLAWTEVIWNTRRLLDISKFFAAIKFKREFKK